MKFNLLKFTLLATLLCSACSFTKLGVIEYNNRTVEQINLTSAAIETSATLYNEVIPDVVTEQDEIKTSRMTSAHSEAQKEVNQTSKLLDLQSRNAEQEQATKESITVYLSAADLYLSSYEDMLNYYASEQYKEDIAKVQSLDESLHTHYTTFIEANNDLVEVLEGFVDK